MVICHLKLFIAVFCYVIVYYMHPLITVVRTDYIMIFSNSSNATRISYVHFELLKKCSVYLLPIKVLDK